MATRVVSTSTLLRDLGRWRNDDDGTRRSARPAYVALAESIRLLVHDGRIPLGVALPSERDLAKAAGVSRTTITSTYALLREEGYWCPGRGRAARWRCLFRRCLVRRCSAWFGAAWIGEAGRWHDHLDHGARCRSGGRRGPRRVGGGPHLCGDAGTPARRGCVRRCAAVASVVSADARDGPGGHAGAAGGDRRPLRRAWSADRPGSDPRDPGGAACPAVAAEPARRAGRTGADRPSHLSQRHPGGARRRCAPGAGTAASRRLRRRLGSGRNPQCRKADRGQDGVPAAGLQQPHRALPRGGGARGVGGDRTRHTDDDRRRRVHGGTGPRYRAAHAGGRFRARERDRHDRVGVEGVLGRAAGGLGAGEQVR